MKKSFLSRAACLAVALVLLVFPCMTTALAADSLAGTYYYTNPSTLAYSKSVVTRTSTNNVHLVAALTSQMQHIQGNADTISVSVSNTFSTSVNAATPSGLGPTIGVTRTVSTTLQAMYSYALKDRATGWYRIEAIAQKDKYSASSTWRNIFGEWFDYSPKVTTFYHFVSDIGVRLAYQSTMW